MFGVTPAMIAQQTQGFAFLDEADSATEGPTVPSRSECEAKIARVGARIAGYFVALGASVPTPAEPAAWATAQELLLLEVTAWAQEARTAVHPELARVRMERMRLLWKELEEHRSRLMEVRGTGASSPGLARGPLQPYRRAAAPSAQLWRSGGV